MALMEGVVEFDPRRATRDEWRRYHAYRRLEQRETRPDDPLTPDGVEEVLLRRGDSRRLFFRWMLTAGDEVVSMLHADATSPANPEYETNRHLLDASVHVLGPHRRRGIGRAWLPTVRDLMDRLGASVLTASAEEEPGHAFLRALGAEPRLTDRASRLDLRRVDWAMVDRWVADGEARSPGWRLTIIPDRVPDDLLDEYMTAANELLNTMPFEDLDHGKIVMTPDQVREGYARLDETGGLIHTAIVRDADGSIAGMTDVMRLEYEPGRVHQLFTGVHPRARGRRIGRWLKAALLRYVRERHPDTVRIDTENAGSNRWMLAINEQLGFRPVRLVTHYQLERARLDG
jgi:GNAT superfamily N-acetyltransferase